VAAPVPDIANIGQGSYQGTSPRSQGLYTVAAGDNRLFYAIGAASSSAGPPGTVGWNGNALALIGHFAFTSSGTSDISFWYADNLTPGTGPATFTNSASWTALGYAHIPVSGVDTSRIPVIGTGAGATSVAPACSVAGGISTDIYLAGMVTRAATNTDNQPAPNQLANQNTINTLYSFAADYLAGNSSGNFSWTVAANDWAAIGLLLHGLASAGGGSGGLWGGGTGLIGAAAARGLGGGSASGLGLWDGISGLR
jgi:hypothetical protein